MTKILLTGGSGFIGRNLAEDLRARGHEVLAPRHAELELLDPEAVADWLAEHRVDAVVHGAVRPGHRNAADPSEQLSRNLRMYFNLARCSDLFGRFILLGSGAVYDARAYRPKMAEDYYDTSVPADDHGFSKYVIDKHLLCVPGSVDLRIFGVFGPGEDYSIRFISNAICKALFGLPITLRQDRMFDYLWVHDLAPVVEHFFDERASGGAFNVTPDQAVSLRVLAELVRDTVNEATGSAADIRIAEGGLGAEYSGSNARLREEIPALELTQIRDSVAELVRWYAERIDTLDRSALLVDK